MASRRNSTNRIYNAIWKVFHKWYTVKLLWALELSLDIVLEFLQYGLESRLTPATLKRKITALDSVLSHSLGFSLSKCPHICWFLKEATIISPTQNCRFRSWKLLIALTSLTKALFEPITDVHLKWLHLKTIFLVTIMLGR